MAGRLRARPAERVVWCGHHAAREATGVDGKRQVEHKAVCQRQIMPMAAGAGPIGRLAEAGRSLGPPRA